MPPRSQRAGVLLAAGRERVEAELVAVAPDVVGSESCAAEQRPEVARVVVRLVVVHLIGGAHTDAERGQLEEPLSPPAGNVDEQEATRDCDPAEFGDRLL